MTDVERTVRFFAAISIAMVPMLLVGWLLPALGIPVNQSNQAWAIVCSCLLMGPIAYRSAGRLGRPDKG